MQRVKVSELRNHLSRYLRAVKAGERVEVLDRTTPVAWLVPVSAAAGDSGAASGEAARDRERLEELARLGLVRLAPGKTPAQILSKTPPGKPGLLAALLAERRGDSR